MTETVQSICKKIPPGVHSPALRIIRDVVASGDAKIDESIADVGQLMATWSVRYWNAFLQGHRIVGLTDLIRVLATTGRETQVRQLAVTGAGRTALLFTDSTGEVILGGVIAPVNGSQRQTHLSLTVTPTPAFLKAYS